MREFTFDVKIFATVRVKAGTETEARAMLQDGLDGADTNFGAWPDGSPILGECGMDGEADLVEVDGEYV